MKRLKRHSKALPPVPGRTVRHRHLTSSKCAFHLGISLGYLESHRGRRRIIASTQVSIKGKHHGKPTDVSLDPKRRRFGEMARGKGVPISDEMRRLIDDACESILNERRRQAIEQLISLG